MVSYHIETLRDVVLVGIKYEASEGKVIKYKH